MLRNTEPALFVFVYRNHKGEVARRTVTPLSVRFGSTEWHPEAQWLLQALDHDRGAEREFAMRDIGVVSPFPTWRNKAARDVIAERKRQVEAEGWTSEHDDGHSDGQIAMAASSYAWSAARDFDSPTAPNMWPWRKEEWKSTDRRRDLVKAGALILAEIERLDRLSVPPAQEPPR